MQISVNRYRRGKRIVLFLFAVVYMLCCMLPSSASAEGTIIGGGKAVTGQADGIGYGVKFYNADNGLPTTDANAVLSSSDGFIWIGGSGGLVRYDGTDFERQGDTVTVITENGGILIRVRTELFDAAGKSIFAALTGDQCAVTNIRIINKDGNGSDHKKDV